MKGQETVRYDAVYELEIESHDSSTEDDVIEVLEANFYGTLDDKCVEKNDPSRNIIIQNLNVENHLENEHRKIVNYKVIAKDNDTVQEIFESWKERYNFDELAFKNYDFENKSIRIRQVSRL